MHTSRLESMTSKMSDSATLLMKFQKLVSRKPEMHFLVFEGNDDPAFYSTIIRRCGVDINYLPFTAGGKDKVLTLRDIIAAHSERNFGKGVLFFIDHDFDDHKEYSRQPSTYCTPTYSIENIAASQRSLTELLINEFKLSTAEGLDDIENIVEKFGNASCEFFKATETLNKVIYFGRVHCNDSSSPKIKSITDDYKKIFKIDSSTMNVSKSYSDSDVFDLVKFEPTPPKIDDIKNTVEKEFSVISPQENWRGKFWIDFFKKFISILVEDINSKKPIHFSDGNAKVKISLGTDSIFRILATSCDIPTCLSKFILNYEENLLKAG